MSKRSRNWTGAIVALGGVGLLVLELHRYYAHEMPLNPWILGIVTVIVFVGGSIVDTAKATQIGTAVVTGAVTIIKALPIPFGRRATDQIAAAGGTVVIPPTGEHGVPTSVRPPKPASPPLPVPPKELATDQAAPDPNAGVGGIL
jgi:hypothetical protein